MSKKRFNIVDVYPSLAVAIACLLLVVLFTWVYFVKVPYLGLSIDIPNARITDLYVQMTEKDSLRPGDIIQAIGDMNWAERAAQPKLPTFPPVAVDQVVPFTILRDGQTLTVNWRVAGFTWAEFSNRFLHYWYLAYIFWAFGLFSVILITPRDLRVGMMSALFFVIGVWIIYGAVSGTRLFYSNTLLRMTSWILLAVSLHFHWIFPRPLARLDKKVFWLLYLVCVGFVLAELFDLLPLSAFFFAVALAALAGFTMLLVNITMHPELRRQASLTLWVFPFILMILIPFTLLGYVSGIAWLGEFGLVALVALPLTYFYVLYSRQMGGMQFRTHRLISQAVFVTIVFLVAAIINSLFNLVSEDVGFLAVTSVVALVLAAIAGVAWYPPFETWFERHFLGMPVPPAHLLPWYSARLAESLDTGRLGELLRTQVFPDLLVRQAALVRWTGDPAQPQTCILTPIVQMQVSPRQLPLAPDLQGLLSTAGRVVPQDPERPITGRLAWVRLAISLSVEGQPIAICLLGRRDPDDEYALTEIQLLQALMDQTALALVHIDLATRLTDFLQADIQRQEAERSLLARELHDSLLGKMAVLAQEGASLEPGSNSDSASWDRVTHTYREAVHEIRSLISNLRSGVLIYGLHLALEDLVEEIQENLLNREQPVQIALDLRGEHYRYPEDVELHIFRIVQQACLNALQHARPHKIQITGDFWSDQIQIKISDDGDGFQIMETPDLAQLLVEKHFGIVGMIERAMLIQANLTFDSAPGQGTEICIAWQLPMLLEKIGTNDEHTVSS